MGQLFEHREMDAANAQLGGEDEERENLIEHSQVVGSSPLPNQNVHSYSAQRKNTETREIPQKIGAESSLR
jgi:hypothetical protein